jgi:hypothetical protein
MAMRSTESVPEAGRTRVPFPLRARRGVHLVCLVQASGQPRVTRTRMLDFFRAIRVLQAGASGPLFGLGETATWLVIVFCREIVVDATLLRMPGAAGACRLLAMRRRTLMRVLAPAGLELSFFARRERWPTKTMQGTACGRMDPRSSWWRACRQQHI